MAAMEDPVVLSFEAPDESQFEEFLRLIDIETAGYRDQTLQMMQLNWEEFIRLVQTVGQVYVVRHAQVPVGYAWIEKRERTLHLHGLFIKEEYQGRGHGKAVLRYLSEGCRGQVDVIELGVHQSNERARRLYEKTGFVTVKHLPEMGFEVMQLRIGEKQPAGE